jgi:hypothetical protein
MTLRKMPLITTLVLISGGAVFGLTANRPAAHAAPPAKPPAPTPSPSQPAVAFADVLSGKTYPNTIKRDELAPAYHFITVIDAQGNPAQCATKGETQTFGGETFLVAYRLPDALPRPAGTTDPPQLPDARLILINMHSIEVIGGFRDTETPPPAADTPPTAGAAPMGTNTTPPGTAP